MNGIKKLNRRRGPDSMVKAINIFAGVSWLLIFIVFILVTYAKPRMSTLFDHMYDINVTQNWNKSLIEYANILLFIIVFICAVGIIINTSRHRRKTDRYNKSLIFFGVVSLLGLIYNLLFK